VTDVYDRRFLVQMDASTKKVGTHLVKWELNGIRRIVSLLSCCFRRRPPQCFQVMSNNVVDQRDKSEMAFMDARHCIIESFTVSIGNDESMPPTSYGARPRGGVTNPG